MSLRKPNMLEAFQASAKVDQTRQEEARAADFAAQELGTQSPSGQPEQPAPETPAMLGVGGPFAGAAGGRRQGAEHSRRPGPDKIFGFDSGQLNWSANRLPLIIGAVLLGMIAMFFLGRGFKSETQAAAAGDQNEVVVPATHTAAPNDPSTRAVERNSAQNPSTARAGATAQGGGPTAADHAFLDRNNRLSVRAIQFANDERGKRRAAEVYRYLLAQGLPAVAPIDQGQILVICVGAEPSRNEQIERIRATLRSLQGPPPDNEPGAFGSAYFVNIEDQIDDDWRH